MAEGSQYDQITDRWRVRVAAKEDAMRIDRAPLTLVCRMSTAQTPSPRYRGEVVTMSGDYLKTHAWESDSPSDIVAWWLQGCPQDGPTLLGTPKGLPVIGGPMFTVEECALIRKALMAQVDEMGALIRKLEGG